MIASQKIATVFGGTGFLGRQVVRDLAKTGITIKVATRVPERAYFLKPLGTVGQIVPFACDYTNPDSIAEAVKGADYVVNCIGILFQKGKRRTFKRAHVEIPDAIARACFAHRVKRLVHVSALGIDKSKSKYAATKRAGEEAVMAAFPNASILRPSVMFGEDDNFFNMFANFSIYFPVLPLIGGGKTKFQPVYVGDVAAAAINALELSDAGDHDPRGKTFELGGPEVVTFKEIMARLFKYTQRPKVLISVPFGYMKFKASFLSLLPKPPLTPDQVESLKADSVVAPGAPGLADLNVAATPMDLILPGYLRRFRPGGRFGDKKAV